MKPEQDDQEDPLAETLDNILSFIKEFNNQGEEDSFYSGEIFGEELDEMGHMTGTILYGEGPREDIFRLYYFLKRELPALFPNSRLLDTIENIVKEAIMDSIEFLDEEIYLLAENYEDKDNLDLLRNLYENADDLARKDIKDVLCEQECYEAMYLLGLDMAEVIKEEPVDAIECGLNVGDETLIRKAIERLFSDGHSCGSDDAQQALGSLVTSGNREMIRLFFKRGKAHICSYDEFDRLYQLALEHNDEETLRSLTEIYIKENKDNSPEDCIQYALAAGDEQFTKKLLKEVGLYDPGAEGYATLIDIGREIMEAVSSRFERILPTDIFIGGPRGSYASISYSTDGA